jgi:hypothetical protein
LSHAPQFIVARTLQPHNQTQWTLLLAVEASVSPVADDFVFRFQARTFHIGEFARDNGDFGQPQRGLTDRHAEKGSVICVLEA